MAKRVEDVSNDPALTATATCNEQHLCSAEPTNRAEVITFSLGFAAMVAGDGNDYTIQDAAGGGREVVMAQKADNNVTASGTGNHVALITASELHVVTTCPATPVTSGNQFTINSWSRTLPDPV